MARSSEASLIKLRRDAVPAMLAASTPDSWRPSTQKDYKGGLACWLRFRFPGLQQKKPEPSGPWQHWVDDFLRFLETHRGLAPRTRRAYADVLRDYLKWQFGAREPMWQRVEVKDVWEYAYAFQRDRQAGTLNQDLRRLRRFFMFVHMRGACSPQLVAAVPRFCNFGHATRTQVLTDCQRRALLASFNRRTPLGARNYCMAVCMVDLGLRPVEVIQLTLADVDWNRSAITVPATKTGRGRQLPMMAGIASALRDYVQHHRPATDCERVFVRLDLKRIGTAMDSRAVAYAMEAAYRRCKFPGRWVGAYRLRHTFATRLHARGADLKQIADLLGHQHLQTTTIYAKTDPVALRALAFPWPL